MTDAIKLPSSGFQTDSALCREDESLDTLEPHDLADLCRCSVQERASVRGPIRTQPRYFRHFVLLSLRSNGSSDNHRAYQLAVNLSTEAKAMPYNLIVMPMQFSYERVSLFQG
jgi:hypothetical protein